MITQAIVDLAHDLDASIVAEGVESDTQLQLLKQWGCDAAQGFFLSEPLDSESLRALLRNPAQSSGIGILMQRQPVSVNITLPIQSTTALQNG